MKSVIYGQVSDAKSGRKMCSYDTGWPNKEGAQQICTLKKLPPLLQFVLMVADRQEHFFRERNSGRGILFRTEGRGMLVLSSSEMTRSHETVKKERASLGRFSLILFLKNIKRIILVPSLRVPFFTVQLIPILPAACIDSTDYDQAQAHCMYLPWKSRAGGSSC